MSRNLIKKIAYIQIALLSCFLIGCTKKEAETSKTLNLAIWGNYIPQENIDAFTKQTGIKVNVSNYASNEELLAKIQAGGAGFDVIVPSDYMVEILAKMNLLQSLDKSKIPNASLVDPKFLNKPYDPSNTYSLPYNFGVTGIAYNTELVKKDITSWKQIFEDPTLKGKVSLLDDVRETTAVALKVNGASLNTTDSKQLDTAKKTLLKYKDHVKMFRSDTVDPLSNKEVAVAQAYSSDALQAAAKSGGKIKFVIAEEGGASAIDNVAILKDAKNQEAAHQFINFVLSKEANSQFVKTVLGTPVVQGVREQLPKDLQDMAALFPTDSQLQKLEAIQDLGDKTELYDKIWTEVKTE